MAPNDVISLEFVRRRGMNPLYTTETKSGSVDKPRRLACSCRRQQPEETRGSGRGVIGPPCGLAFHPDTE